MAGNKKLQLISYAIVTIMLSTSIIYLVVTYQQLTDESGSDFHEIAGKPENQQTTSDLDKSQWNEIDFGSKIQTVFFLVVGVAYVPIGIWMLTKRDDKRPYVIAFGGSLSLIVLYAMSRTVNLPVVGIQSDVGMIDIASKVLQGGIIAGSSYLIGKIDGIKVA